MTDREVRAARNQESSLTTFLARKAEFDTLLAELQVANDEHFGADPEDALWVTAATLEHWNKGLHAIGSEPHDIAELADDAPGAEPTHTAPTSTRRASSPRLREALQAVGHGKQDILDASVLEFVHDPEPELRALVLLEPEAENLLGAVGPDGQAKTWAKF